MTKLQCRLIVYSTSIHLQQIFTGLNQLQQQGYIQLAHEIQLEKRTNLRHLCECRVVVNDSLQLHFDTHDSQAVDEVALEEVDFYFKRGLRSDLSVSPAHRHKLHPFGLNYVVYPDRADLQSVWRNLRTGLPRERILYAARSLPVLDPLVNRIVYTPRLSQMHSIPTYTKPARAIFMVRTWDPQGPDALNEAMAEEWHSINEMRASCIRALRTAFGDRFYGGFGHSEYARRTYPDCLLPDPRQAKQQNYLQLLRSHAIGIATTGLHGSIGWKFGEYVAFARAIVSETLNFEPGGDFAAERNYLPFKSADECVIQVDRLLKNEQLLEQMMQSNASYYQTRLRPDLLILQALFLAMGKSHLAHDTRTHALYNTVTETYRHLKA